MTAWYVRNMKIKHRFLDLKYKIQKINISKMCVCVTCAEIVQPGQLPPTEVLIIEQLKL